MSNEPKINVDALKPDPKKPIDLAQIMALSTMGPAAQQLAQEIIADRTVELGGTPTEGGITYGDLEIDGVDHESDSFEAKM